MLPLPLGRLNQDPASGRSLQGENKGLDVDAEGNDKAHQPFDGDPLKLVMLKRRHFRLIDRQRPCGEMSKGNQQRLNGARQVCIDESQHAGLRIRQRMAGFVLGQLG